MPIMEYKCTKCEKVVDKLVSRKEADEYVEFDCDCGNEDARLQRTENIGAASLRFRGNWYATTRTY